MTVFNKIATLLLFLFPGCFMLYGQDIHLSQFYTSDHLLNPAKVGDYDGDYRIAGNYRNQWREISDPLSTYIISFDKTINYYIYEIEVGMMVARDEFAGFNQVSNKILLSGAYAFKWKGHALRAGIQPGFVFRSTDLSKQTFPVQWDYSQGEFDQNTSHRESGLAESQMHFDFNAGMQWSKKFRNFTAKAGFALNHLNRPKDTYFDDFTERLRTRKVFNAEMDYELGTKTSISPKLLVMSTTRTNETLLGANLHYDVAIQKISEVYAGLFYRHGVNRNFDAVYPVIGLSYDKFDIGFSYDINMSGLSKGVRRKSTFEFSLIYTASSFMPRQNTVPCERF